MSGLEELFPLLVEEFHRLFSIRTFSRKFHMHSAAQEKTSQVCFRSMPQLHTNIFLLATTPEVGYGPSFYLQDA